MKNITLLLTSTAALLPAIWCHVSHTSEFLNAIKKGDMAEMRRLLPQIDIEGTDANGRTALMEASLNGRINVVKFLLERNANVHATDPNGRTALIWASWNGHTGVMHSFS